MSNAATTDGRKTLQCAARADYRCMSYIYDYQPEEALPKFDCADGVHRVRIVGAMFLKSKNNKQFVQVRLAVDGATLPFDHKIYEGNGFNFYMTQVFDAFGIQRGNFNVAQWVGRNALAEFAHAKTVYDGREYTKAEIKSFSPNAPNATAPAPNVPPAYAPPFANAQ